MLGKSPRKDVHPYRPVHAMHKNEAAQSPSPGSLGVVRTTNNKPMNSPLHGQRASRYTALQQRDRAPKRRQFTRSRPQHGRGPPSGIGGGWTDGISSCPDSGTLARSGFHSGRVLSGNRYSAIWDALARGFATPELHHSLGPDLRGAGRGGAGGERHGVRIQAFSSGDTDSEL